MKHCGGWPVLILVQVHRPADFELPRFAHILLMLLSLFSLVWLCLFSSLNCVDVVSRAVVSTQFLVR